ncbi:hypothetical protein ACFQ48_12865 [Hymenobacter caeli]|uniref:DUF4231 domain-containing protein n=1 Tax=Hymenobacter caeli TaxID=2735894 RepID=A0ABX2FTI1_9BACT|nr:hypothetical protein [Hymenobacter caeli]NRT20272.1 hypothetical protein [Hymenobacter caeli]
MEFYQKHPVWGHTRLTTTEDGLLVDRKRLTNYVRTEIPYEELLPVRGKMERSFPLVLSFFVAFGVVGSWAQELGKPIVNQAYLVASGAASLVVAGVCYFTYTRWQNRFVLTTGKGDFSVVAQPENDAEMQQFVDDLRAYTRAYLHQRYVYPNQELTTKKGVSRWYWLHEMKVISTEEFQAGFTANIGKGAK